MKVSPSKLVLPGLFIALGILFIILASTTKQNSEFIIGSVAIIAIGVISLLFALNIISKSIQIVVTIVLIIGSFTLAALDYKSIKDPLDFMKTKTERDAYVIQNLKDLRTIELAYKAVKGSYSNNFDSLEIFVKSGKFPVIKASGFVPDGMTEDEAIKQSYYKKDTSYVSIMDSLFSKNNLNGHLGNFVLDSVKYIPFGHGEKFVMEAGEIERNNVKVKVFQISAPIDKIYADFEKRYYDKEKSLAVGSMIDPSTSGNWGE